MIVVDRSEIARFVTLFRFAAPGTYASLRAFRDDADGTWGYEHWSTVKIEDGNLDNVVDAAMRLAQRCAEADTPVCFACPIASFANADKADVASLADGLVVSAELDSNPSFGRRRLEEALGAATLIIESGGLWTDPETGEIHPKLHLHWLLATPTRNKIEHDFLREINRLATELAGGDPTAIALVHPLRWPGSVHRKATPRLARIIEYNPEIAITWAEALNKLRAAVAAQTKTNGKDPGAASATSQTLRQAGVLDLTAALAVIPNNDSDPGSWDRWNDMGLRLYAATDGSDLGLVLFLGWSRSSAKFDEATTRARWQHYAGSPPDRTNAGAIFNLAKAAWSGFVRPSEYARRAGFDVSLDEFLDRPTPENIEPDPVPSEPQPPRGNGRDAAAEERSDNPLLGPSRRPRQCPPSMGREETFTREAKWFARLLKTAKGSIRPCLANAVMALRHAPEWEDRLWYDMFHNRVVLRGIPPWSNRPFADEPWSDLFDNRTTVWMQHHGIIVSHEIVGRAVWTVAQDQWFHPVRQYLEVCRRAWDGQKRVFNWPTTYLGTPYDAYSTAVGQRWLISLVARVMEPGCKADSALVLEGPQGIFKSEVLRKLGWPWVTDDMGGAPLGSKDAALQVAGVWIMELAELDQFTTGRDVAKTKSFMSRMTDRFRPPYGTHPIPQARQCGFGCTTNKTEYLPDETGNRRWWPLICTGVDLAQLDIDRDQLFGEAVALYEAGEPWWLDTPELNTLAATEQDQRYVPDAWDDVIRHYLDNPTEEQWDSLSGQKITLKLPPFESITVGEILEQALGLKPGEWQQPHQNRVARSLRALKWVRRQKQVAGDRAWRYHRPEEE